MRAEPQLQRKRQKSDKLYERAAGVAVEGAIPFKKTPLNIAKRGVEYSPLGLMKGIYDAAFSVKNGKKTAAQAIDAIAAGLTGTAVMLLGLFLRRIGLVRGTGSGDKGEERLDSATGYQEYALMIGDSSYTIDWLAPASMPFFMGVNMWDSYEQTDKFTCENVVNAVVKMPDPLFSLSVLSSLNDIRKAGKFAETDAESYGACAWQMGVSYLGQAFPTISGQIARTIDGTQRDTYHADKTNGIPDGLERFLMKQMAKIPWLSKNLNPVIDMWGREESYGDTVGDRLIGNMISPGYYKEIDSTFLDNELRRLNQEYEGEESVFPPKIPSSFDNEKKKYIMTPTEYTRYSIVRGRTSYELADELVRSKKYRKMSAEEKQKALKSCYTKAGEKAKFEILKGRGVDVSGKKKTQKQSKVYTVKTVPE